MHFRSFVGEALTEKICPHPGLFLSDLPFEEALKMQIILAAAVREILYPTTQHSEHCFAFEFP